MSCIDNLDKCHAACCRVLSFNIPSFPNDGKEKYYKAHKCKITRLNRNMINIVVKHDCAQLDGDKCKLHGTKAKPPCCVGYNEQSAKTKRYYVPDECRFNKMRE